MTTHEFTTDLQVRFRDVDAMGHVNNAVYATYLEQARADYFAAVVGASLTDVETVLVHLELDYRRPIELGDPVTVALRVANVGESSVTMEYEVRADGEVAATAETTQVAYDRTADAARPVPDDWRRAIEEHRAGEAPDGA